MPSRHTFLALFVALALGLPVAARADIPPMDSCSGAAEGSACTNAAPSYTAAGTCTTTTCTRTLPPMGGGQPMQMTYACKLCLPRAADAGADGGAPKDEKKDDGCAYGGRGDAGLPGLALGLAALALFARRRR